MTLVVTTKLCNTCSEHKPVEEFHVRNKAKGYLQSKCKECHRKYHRQHYLDNKDSYLSQARDWRAKEQAWVNSIKARPCADCNQQYPWYVMQFDHVSGSKEDNIAQMLGNVSRERLETEIAKCEVVCANCHMVRTYLRTLRTCSSVEEPLSYK